MPAWLDVTAGVSGDMVLGALVDAGCDLAVLQAHVDAVIPATVRLTSCEVQRAGTRATKVDVAAIVADHPHRSWSEIRHRLESADLDDRVRDTSLRTFARLAAVEARVHDVAVDDVHFHEVGAWDSIADVVGVCAGLAHLDVTDLVVSSLGVGSGTVATAHGVLPVPAPAVLDMLDGLSVHAGGPGELATPTGVALLTTHATGQGPLPAMTVSATGVGAGSRDTPDRPNVVRLVLGMPVQPVLGESVGEGVDDGTPMALIEANVDDLDPRVWPSVLASLVTAGAADAWLQPILMKKGRPAHSLAVLCTPDLAPTLRKQVLDLTSTIGVRQTTVQRWALHRGWVDVVVDGENVAVKVAHQDGRIVHATPEFDDASTAAARLERPVREVLEAASAAAVSAGVARGAILPSQLRTTHRP